MFQRCQASNWIPSAGGSPASSISSTASGIEEAIVHSSPPSRWYGSSAIRSPSRSASAAIVRSPSTTIARASSGSRPSPVPVRQTIPLGRNGASRSSSRRTPRRARPGPSGPPRSGSGRIDGTTGTAAADVEAARLEQLERRRVAVLAELLLPDADAVEAGGGVEANVVGEARPDRRDLRDRDSRLHPVDPLMTFDI